MSLSRVLISVLQRRGEATTTLGNDLIANVGILEDLKVLGQ